MTALDALVDPWPGPAALSTTTTSRPARASSSATAQPITPAPMTTASASTPVSTRLSVTFVAYSPPCIDNFRRTQQVGPGSSWRGEVDVDLLVGLGALRLGIAAVGELVRASELDIVGERCQQCPRPQSTAYDGIELCGHHEDH